MSIDSINSSNSAMMLGGMNNMRRPDSSKMAEELFSKLDTAGKGYIEKSDLESALGKISGNSSSSSGSSASTDDMFSKLDSNGDGKVTKDEMSASLEKIASQLDGPFPRMRMQGDQGGNLPPPPTQDGGQDDQGFTKDQLSSMSQELSSTDSKRSQIMSDIASNFDAADSNGDGKVSGSEARAFEESKNSSGTGNTGTDTSSSSSVSGADAQFMKQMMQLIHAYGGFNQSEENNRFSTSA